MVGSRLSVVERGQIEVLFGQGLRFPQIGRVLGRSRSTVWREVVRNNAYRGANVPDGAWHPQAVRFGDGGGRLEGVYRLKYSARIAQVKADRRALRPRVGKLVCASPLRAQVIALLAQRWSPGQIAARLRRDYPGQRRMWVSHETIYQAIYCQARGGLRGELARQVALRSGRARRSPQSRAADARRGPGKAWTEGFLISDRPAQAGDRAVPGHWEGDLVLGARGSSAIITLVERSTRFVMLGALPGSRATEQVVGVLIDLMRRLPAGLARTLTWDQGGELAAHTRFTLATDCAVYFADPHSPWQRGSNENTNGLLRQYFPRSSTDFRSQTQADLDAVADQLNTRPRKTLDWDTPAERLKQLLVATTL